MIFATQYKKWVDFHEWLSRSRYLKLKMNRAKYCYHYLAALLAKLVKINDLFLNTIFMY